MKNLLENYRQMIARVDALCRGILDVLAGRITCSDGCSDCCTAITLFSVEAAALRAALAALPEEQQSAIRSHVAAHSEGERCPLLDHHRCLLYAARPIICRTHGLPIIYNAEGQRTTDCCPLNSIEDESVPGSAVIDLDRLNTLLVAVNALYLSHVDRDGLPERLTIADALKVKP
jgi:Fe-S-cluster containining protein